MLGVAVLGRSVAVRGEHDLGDAEAVRGRAAVLQDLNPGRARFDHLTDLCHLPAEDAIASVVHTATALTRAAVKA
jgi:hypothetical protein